MIRSKFIACFLVVAVIVNIPEVNALTEAQVAQAGKILRNMCQPKNKVSDEDIENFHKGVNLDEPSRGLMCYQFCLAKAGKLLKNDKINMEYVQKNLHQLPKPYQEFVVKGLTHCAPTVTATENCEYAYQWMRCMYLYDPKTYFLP